MTKDNLKIESETATRREASVVERLVINPIEIRKYMANCIWHIQSADCDVRRKWERDEDIAEAILIANEHGVNKAHMYLVKLAAEAENGKYATAL